MERLRTIRHECRDQVTVEIVSGSFREGTVVLVRDVNAESRRRLGSMGSMAPVRPQTVVFDEDGRTVSWDADRLEDVLEAIDEAGSIRGAFDLKHDECMGKIRGAYPQEREATA